MIDTIEYINIQTKEVLDMNRLDKLPDNAMLKIYPQHFEIWCSEKNNELGLDIYKMTKATNIRAWWYCPKCDDIYPQSIANKHRGSGCSICNGKYVTRVNCIATTNPSIAKLMLNPQDSLSYTKNSDMKVDWKCGDCGNIIKNRAIKDINRRGLSCSVCSDGVRFPEKVMSGLLAQLKVNYNYDMSTKFSKDKRYDFYLPDYNMIIETHGGQHYFEGFKTIKGSRTLKEEQENDRYKYNLAIKNGIYKYIVIDSRYSELEWIKNSILNSELADVFDLTHIDWDVILLNSTKSNKIECLNMYLKGRRDYKEMANELKVDYATIISWLNFWNKEGKCEYTPFDSSKTIIQLDLEGNYIKEWSSIGKARKQYKNVSKVLNKERSNDQGYRFMYKDDYDKYLQDKSSYSFYVNKKITKQIVQLSIDDEFIREWDSMIDAAKYYGKNNQSGIAGVCNKRKITSIGFKWMYKEEYDKLVKNK